MDLSRAKPANEIRNDVIALKRGRILATAVDMFYEHGYENTTLEAIAERLHVTKPFIYSYFKSKSELLAAICERGITASLEAIDRVLVLPVSATVRLSLLGKQFVIAVLTSQKQIAIFSREEKNLLPADFERISNLRREFDRKLTSLLDQGKATGEFRFADARLVSLAIGGLVSWAYVWYRSRGRFTLDEVADQISELLLDMVNARKNKRCIRRGRAAPRPAKRAGTLAR